MTPETCPACGADVPKNARACPNCGADENTGWSEDAYASTLGLPEESFDYNEFVEREFTGEKIRPRGIKKMWWWVAVALLALMFLGFALVFRH